MRYFELLNETVHDLDVTKNFFNFGSMRDLSIFEAVLDHEIPEENIHAAYLTEHEVVNVIGKIYPALIKNPDRSVKGILVEGLTKNDIWRMDQYKEGLYETEIIHVNLERDPSIEVVTQIYSIHSPKLELTEDPWSFDYYRTNIVPDYLTEVKEFMKNIPDKYQYED